MVVVYCLASIWQFALSTGQVVKINIKINNNQGDQDRTPVFSAFAAQSGTQIFLLVFDLNTKA